MILRLTKELFTRTMIDKAIHDYSGYAKITVAETETHYLCHLSESVYDIQTTASEFENYLINIANLFHTS